MAWDWAKTKVHEQKQYTSRSKKASQEFGESSIQETPTRQSRRVWAVQSPTSLLYLTAERIEITSVSFAYVLPGDVEVEEEAQRDSENWGSQSLHCLKLRCSGAVVNSQKQQAGQPVTCSSLLLAIWLNTMFVFVCFVFPEHILLLVYSQVPCSGTNSCFSRSFGRSGVSVLCFFAQVFPPLFPHPVSPTLNLHLRSCLVSILIASSW